MTTKKIQAKSILTKSGLPDANYCINPYLGCEHGCKYCYASFMCTFSNRPKDSWGNFLDVKINAPEIIKQELKKKKQLKANLGTVHIGSVCDPYQPEEKKYKITRKILKEFLNYPKKSFNLSILTKSNLITRDIDILRKFKNIEVGITISTLDEEVCRRFEPHAPSPAKRIKALKKLDNFGIKTYVFIGPILPGLTQPENIIRQVANNTDKIWLENLNLKQDNWPAIAMLIKNYFPNLKNEYIEMKNDYINYWNKIQNDLRLFALKNKIDLKFVFHHKPSSN